MRDNVIRQEPTTFEGERVYSCTRSQSHQRSLSFRFERHDKRKSSSSIENLHFWVGIGQTGFLFKKENV